jgi:hypothetical protein
MDGKRLLLHIQHTIAAVAALLLLLLLLQELRAQPHLQLEAWQVGGANLSGEVLRALVHPCSVAQQHTTRHKYQQELK